MASISLRPIEPTGDRAFLLDLYEETRGDASSIVEWSDADRRAFVMQQFEAQDTYYRAQFPDARYDVIVFDGVDVGRLYVDRREDEIRILDILVATAHRRRGIGRRLLTELLDEAGARRLPVRIHVEQQNPALRLYEALGFRVLGEVGIYWFMEWSPTSPT